MAIVARLCALLFGTDAGSRLRAADRGRDRGRGRLRSARARRDPDRRSGCRAHASRASRPRRRGVRAPLPTPTGRRSKRDYALIRRHIAAVIPGFDDFESSDREGSHALPAERSPRRAELRHRDGQGACSRRTRSSIRSSRTGDCCCRPSARTTSTTPRSTARTTAIAASTADAGSSWSTRRTSRSWASSRATSSTWSRSGGDGVERRAEEFRIVGYSTPRGNAAAYYPETNVLVPLDSTADISGTPTSKSVIVRLERRAA